jgi:hypothetical protein
MRHCQAVVLALLAVPLAGCLTTPKPRPQEGAGLSPFRGPTGKDVVQLYIALIERPARDPYLDDKVWELADEQGVRVDGVIDLLRKATLADNGFRVAQLAGSPPPELYRLLSSARSCANPRCVTLHAGQPTPVHLGPICPECCFELHRDGGGESVELGQAHCLLEVVPTLDDGGRVVLHFTPTIRHGQTRLVTKPAVDPSGPRYWDLQAEQPTESYAWLGWDLSVGPNEYVLIGTRTDHPETLGARCFLRDEDPAPVQRLLVLRVGRALTDGMPADADEARAAPLALQASWSAARGIAP